MSRSELNPVTLPLSQSSPFGWFLRYPYGFLLAILLLGLFFPFLRKDAALSDWDNVYLRASTYMQAGETIYDPQRGYLYPPLQAFLAIPFTWVPQPVARVAWFLVSAVCLVFLMRWAWAVSGGGKLQLGAPINKSEHVICLLGLLVGLRYCVDCIAHHQTDVVIGMLLMAGCLALLRSRVWLSATLLGMAAAFKCTPLLFCIYFVCRGKWLPAMWLGLVAVVLNLLPSLVFAPPEGLIWGEKWVQIFLLPMKNASHSPGTWGSLLVYNQSLSGLFNRWFCTTWAWESTGFRIIPREEGLSPNGLKLIAYGTELCLLALVSLLWWKRPQRELTTAQPDRVALECSSVLILMLLLSPMSSKPHFCTLLLPGFCLARLVVTRKSWVLAAFLLAAFLAELASVKDLLGGELGQIGLWYGSVTWSAVCLLAGLVYGMLLPTRAENPNMKGKPFSDTESFPRNNKDTFTESSLSQAG